jgi:hypothetical protein
MILFFKFLQEFFNFGWFFIEPGNTDFSVFVGHFYFEVIGFAVAIFSDMPVFDFVPSRWSYRLS